MILPRISLDDFLPKSSFDTLCFLFLLFSITVTFTFELTTVVPYIHNGSVLGQLIHSIAGCYFLHNIILSIYFIISTDTTIRSLILPSTLTQQDKINGWRFCAVCETNSPPRSFHCSTCGICILRRDHHCVFVGKCIGYKNHRYFFSLLFNLSISSLYCIILNQIYIWPVHFSSSGFNFSTFLSHTFPVFSWLFGFISFNTATHCFISVIDIGGFLLTITLLLYNFSNAIYNQTNHEKNIRIRIYDLGSVKDNLNQLFGQNGYLILFSPLFTSNLPNDGISFPSKSQHLSNSKKHK